MNKFSIKSGLVFKSNLAVLLLRLLIPISLVWILRVIFYLHNADMLAIVSWPDELPNILRGSFIFDASNMTVTFGLFVFLSLLPFNFRAKKTYQTLLFVCFVLAIIILVVLNITDAIYFHYASKRITIDEFSYFNNDNTFLIFLKGFVENWVLSVFGLLLIVLSIWLYKCIKCEVEEIRSWLAYVKNVFLFILAMGVMLVAFRGGIGRTIRPITLSNAAQFVESPNKSYIILSNPFCIVKTLKKNQSNYVKYFSESTLDSLFLPVRSGSDAKVMKRKNVVIFILESFSFEHSAFLNPHLYKSGENYTPFIDSLMQQGYIFDKCYSNGHKSIDALPSIITSIPSFKTPFALTQEALSPTNGIGQLLGDEGWETWFFNGSENRSMGFVAYAKSAGYNNFRTRENYEKQNGKNDFDGYWGIWDEPFLKYMANELNSAKEPFLATTFTLTSHHPFIVPEKYKNTLPEGNTRAHKCVAYTDMSLRKFFDIVKTKKWYDNTLFVFVADHVSCEVYSSEAKSGAENTHIIYFLYAPDGSVKGRSSTVTQQIDIMPTVLGLLDYNKAYFAFGRDVFASQNNGFAINYNGSAYQWITDTATYIFNEKTTGNKVVDEKVKAFVQRYYLQLEKRKFTVE